MGRRIARLVPRKISAVTVRRLTEMATEAQEPDGPVGIAYVLIYRTRYKVDAVGQANENPLLTRAMVLDLYDLLRERQLTRP